jgi:hypothetical protein
VIKGNAKETTMGLGSVGGNRYLNADESGHGDTAPAKSKLPTARAKAGSGSGKVVGSASTVEPPKKDGKVAAARVNVNGAGTRSAPAVRPQPSAGSAGVQSGRMPDLKSVSQDRFDLVTGGLAVLNSKHQYWGAQVNFVADQAADWVAGTDPKDKSAQVSRLVQLVGEFDTDFNKCIARLKGGKDTYDGNDTNVEICLAKLNGTFVVEGAVDNYRPLNHKLFKSLMDKCVAEIMGHPLDQHKLDVFRGILIGAGIKNEAISKWIEQKQIALKPNAPKPIEDMLKTKLKMDDKTIHSLKVVASSSGLTFEDFINAFNKNNSAHFAVLNLLPGIHVFPTNGLSTELQAWVVKIEKLMNSPSNNQERK